MNVRPNIAAQDNVRPSDSKRSSTMESISDSDLIRKIAEDRDKQAFQELHQRYVQSSFNLAMYLLRDAQLAEDVAQDSLSRVWIFASSFETGSVKSWILCIVAREAIRKSRRKYRKHEKSTLDHASSKASIEHSPEKHLEQVELLGCLRARMNKLPDMDRKILGLYYGAGLSQALISKELSIPQRTVSFKLKNLLDGLRAHLVKVGVAAVITSIKPENLFEVMTSGQASSSGLSTNALHLISKTRLNSLSESKAMTGAGFPIAAAVVGMIIVAGLIFAMPFDKHEAEAPGAVNATSDAAVDSVAPALPASGAWSFDEGPPPSGMMLSGDWTWGKSESIMKGVLAARSSDDMANLLLPLEPPKQSFVLTLKFKHLRTGPASWKALWGNKNSIIPANVHYLDGMDRLLVGPQERIYTCSFYFWDRWVLMIQEREEENQIWNIAEYQHAYPGNKIILSAKSLMLLSISVSPLPVKEFPFKPASFLKRLTMLKKEFPGHTRTIKALQLDLKPFKKNF